MMAHPASPRDPDRYLTIADGAQIETRVKGSRFVAQVIHTRDETEAANRLHAIRKRYRDATHHCWAFRLGTPGEALERFDDDGEPSGTAGQPILGALIRADVYEALAVVTRYFGGTKLGTGGLTRAYGDAARQAMEDATPRPRWLQATLSLACSFDDVGTVETLLGKRATIVQRIDREFDPHPVLRVCVKRSHAEGLRTALVEATAGRVSVRIE